MPNQSATINVMIQAARKAAKSLLKDFTEVENLQASTKSPGDFVSKADLRAAVSYTHLTLPTILLV